MSRERLLGELGAMATAYRSEGVVLEERDLERIAGFIETLHRWSVHTNLMGARDLPHVVEKHVAPSLLPLLRATIAALGPTARYVDIGTGGGFPGLVLGLVRPSWSTTLVESILKKAAFLREVAEPRGIAVLRARAEEVTDRALLGRCALVTARAVAPPHALWPVARRFLAPDGELHVWVPRAEEPAIRDGLLRAHRDARVLASITPAFYPGAVLCLAKAL